jgi:UDP-N-acetylglucosamine--N-acetylmuramyl-(pentapeptide) pyrophosphoryl-undecaprenol N-acetylglucosamine transferase
MSAGTHVARHAVIMAGGTGGHVFPGLAVARELRRRGWTVSWLGTRRGLEARLVPAAGIELDLIRIVGLRGRGLGGWLTMPFRLGWALAAARGILRRRRPDVVLGLGGYVSGPGGLAARMLGLPLVVHEQNAVAGMTNRKLAGFAVRVLEAFPGSFPPEVEVHTVGNPVRRELAELPAPGERKARRSGPIRLLIIGGSQGARALNRVLPPALAGAGLDIEVRHQCGARWQDETEAAWRQAGVRAEVFPFIDDMASAWSWADIAVCRAGALTVSELMAVGLGAVLVPFPAAVDDHQSRNARFMESAGAAVLIQESELDAAGLRERLTALCVDRERLLDMARRAREIARPDADRAVADHCEAVAASREAA